jgi:hypothetical protein
VNLLDHLLARAPEHTSNSACSCGEVVWWTTISLAIAVPGGVPADQRPSNVVGDQAKS